tara:strand:+ start:282 stop:749 length:468 start_codon:yes stop_codon:yes gene_type:complete
MKLKEGQSAPEFSLNDKSEKNHSLKDITNEYIVVYFYPKDNTPGCTIEAKRFSNTLKEFEKLNTTIIGISGGDQKSKTKFCDKHNLKLTLLSDPDFKVSESYGVYGEKSFMGKKYMGISRQTFILNKDHKIIKIYEKVKPLIHTKEVLEFIKGKQ